MFGIVSSKNYPKTRPQLHNHLRSDENLTHINRLYSRYSSTSAVHAPPPPPEYCSASLSVTSAGETFSQKAGIVVRKFFIPGFLCNNSGPALPRLQYLITSTIQTPPLHNLTSRAKTLSLPVVDLVYQVGLENQVYLFIPSIRFFSRFKFPRRIP